MCRSVVRFRNTTVLPSLRLSHHACWLKGKFTIVVPFDRGVQLRTGGEVETEGVNLSIC